MSVVPEVAFDLEAVPEGVGSSFAEASADRLSEEGTEADRHGGRDGTLAVDDLVDGAGGRRRWRGPWRFGRWLWG